MNIQEHRGSYWVTDICDAHITNHRGCKAAKMVRQLKKLGYSALLSNGCIMTNATYNTLQGFLPGY